MDFDSGYLTTLSSQAVSNANTAKIVLEWLEKWNIPYDEIIYGKPWPGHNGFYVDDRTVRPDEFLKYDAKKLEAICKESRCG